MELRKTGFRVLETNELDKICGGFGRSGFQPFDTDKDKPIQKTGNGWVVSGTSSGNIVTIDATHSTSSGGSITGSVSVSLSSGIVGFGGTATNSSGVTAGFNINIASGSYGVSFSTPLANGVTVGATVNSAGSGSLTFSFSF